MEDQGNNNIITRAPIVVVLGHVDHGKTTLLDYIKKTNIADRESGGITQHIGAYEIEHSGKKITFVDTPGHEAFSAMRSRGARVADIAILVVAADESVKQQTKEAINVIKSANIPYIVAINKVDRERANVQKTKTDLATNDVLVETMGGTVPSVNTSAKAGTGIPELLDLILLIAEMEDLKADISQKGTGIIIESYLDKQRGPIATLIVTDGVLKKADIIGCASAMGKIKSLESYNGKPLDKVMPSQPCSVMGFEKVPNVGDEFMGFATATEATEFVVKKEKEVVVFDPDQADKKNLHIILKADVAGSLEPIVQILTNLPQQEVGLKILKQEVGNITEEDIKTAIACNAKIIAFRVKTDSAIQRLSEDKKIRILNFDVIYNLLQGVEVLMKELIKPKTIRTDLGQLKVLFVFFTEGNRQIIGGRVVEGEVDKGAQIEIIREGEVVGKGRMIGMEKNKKDVDHAVKRDEIGIKFEGDEKIKEDDILNFYVVSTSKS